MKDRIEYYLQSLKQIDWFQVISKESKQRSDFDSNVEMLSPSNSFVKETQTLFKILSQILHSNELIVSPTKVVFKIHFQKF